MKEWHRPDDLAEDGRGDDQAGRGVAVQDAQPAGVGLLRERQLGRALQSQQGSAQVSQRGEQVAWKLEFINWYFQKTVRYFSLSIQNSALEIATTMAFYLSIFLAAKAAPISRNVRQLVSKAQ